MTIKRLPLNLVCVLAIATVLLMGTTPLRGVEPPHEPKHEFMFVVLGDSQFELPNTFNRVIDEVVHLNPAFVIQVGDMISGYVENLDEFRAQWRRFKAQIAPLGSIPFCPVPGNHDVMDATRKPGGELVYREIWGDTYYSFNYRNAHFIVLNTEDRGECEIVGEQLVWLTKDLKKARKRAHIFILSHQPIYRIKNGDALHELFVKYGVSAVFCGHLHHYNYQERDGIPYVMASTAVRLGTPFPLGAGSFHHMLLVTVRDNTFRIAVLKAGSVLPLDIVALEDNQELYGLQRRFFSQKRVALDSLKQTGNTYEVTMRVNNPSHQDLTAYFEWQLPNERWVVDPLTGRRILLPAGVKNHPLTFTLGRKFPHPPEAFPSCVARALYLTSDGDVVQSEHVFKIVGKIDED